MRLDSDNAISCCCYFSAARIFKINPRRKQWRALFFLDECPVCGAVIAEIREKAYNGKATINVRRVGKAALRLYQKCLKERDLTYIIQKGSKINEQYKYQNNGNVYSLNDRFIAKMEDYEKNQL